MSKSRSTKVPAMRENQPYADWKKELRIWQVTNTTLEVDKAVQAGMLYSSLNGTVRDTVLSEVGVEGITAQDGVDSIIATLDRFYMGNATQNAFNAIDDLINYKCDDQTSMEQFIVNFQLKVNKVKGKI